MSSSEWKPTMNLRWVDINKADNPQNAVRAYVVDNFQRDIHYVLQQKWVNGSGSEKWKDVSIDTGGYY